LIRGWQSENEEPEPGGRKGLCGIYENQPTRWARVETSASSVEPFIPARRESTVPVAPV
jgi:hypothetical protein